MSLQYTKQLFLIRPLNFTFVHRRIYQKIFLKKILSHFLTSIQANNENSVFSYVYIDLRPAQYLIRIIKKSHFPSILKVFGLLSDLSVFVVPDTFDR